MARVAINGLGRIGRASLKIISDTPELELVAINDLVPTENLAYLLKYDTVYGRYEKDVRHDNDRLIVGDKSCQVFHEKDPLKLPWKELGIDIVLECTGVFTKKNDLEMHLRAGAKRVILSAPTKSEEVLTVVHGVSSSDNLPEIISCASCTTNCITPVVEIIGRRIGIQKAIMTTIHAYTASQALVDGPGKNMRRGRAGAENLVPTSTGAAIATTKALPQYKGKFDGVSVRVPIPVGSLADIVFISEKNTSVEQVNQILTEEATTKRYQGILRTTDEPIVSSDIIKDSHASIVDMTMTQVVDGNLVKIMAWYDNEWGYANQMIRKAVDIYRSMKS
ncbi:type I glyceraldehyde-3-phosphate dehydrogenase [candidate division KSB1 bacterium]|nr:type I glyceraldehyde-3-phosphate dehydrogenase [candidate division KSB1 bacterium]